MKDVVIKKVALGNFRIHESYVLDVNKKTTSILGENGCGKTSVLEAIYIAMCGKSFRAVDRDILRRKAEYYRVEVEYSNGEKTVVVYDGEKAVKNFLIQDKKYTRLPKKFRYPVVLFLPEDLHLISSSPTRRREYFDRILAQIDDSYGNFLLRYNKALKQRNELLKQENISREALFSWDVMLANYGVALKKKREKMIADINEELTKVYQGIADNNDSVEILYESELGDVLESEYIKLLNLDYDRDVATGHTNFGVHKDNYKFIFNGSDADGSASRGETRSMIIALKFIEARMLFEKNGKRPVVLLDDVFSELDKVRRKCLVENFKENQVILTSVEGA